LLRILDEDKSNFSNLYKFIVSEVIDRQWSQLIGDIEEGWKVTFGRFLVFSSAIYREGFVGGHGIIALGRIAGCHFANGELIIHFVDDKRRPKRKKLGPVCKSPALISSELSCHQWRRRIQADELSPICP
jgi:hypothetical protein